MVKLRLGNLGIHIMPVLVWLAAVGGVVFLLMQRAERFEFTGMARGRVRQVSSTVSGKLKSVPVELFSPVKTGQTVAVLDDEQLKAQLATVQAEIARLTAELASTQEQLKAEASGRENDRVVNHRRFVVDVENARLRILELKATIESDKIILGDLGVELKIAEDLLSQKAIAAYELEKAQVQYDSLAKKIAENERLVEQAQKNLAEAQSRLADFERQQVYEVSVDVALDVIRKAITVEEERMKELRVQSGELVLSSPVDGVVSQLFYRAGEAVMAGAPIMTISETEPTEIVVYAGERQLGLVKEGMAVKVVKMSVPQQIASSRVVQFGPSMEVMPERLWHNPDVPEWGRPVVISIAPRLKLVPGELVGIKGL